MLKMSKSKALTGLEMVKYIPNKTHLYRIKLFKICYPEGYYMGLTNLRRIIHRSCARSESSSKCVHKTRGTTPK